MFNFLYSGGKVHWQTVAVVAGIVVVAVLFRRQIFGAVAKIPGLSGVAVKLAA